MAQKFMKTQEVAEFLGMAPSEVSKLRETHVLHAYRDGADWKFKAEDVEQYARSRQQPGGESPAASEDESDVLLSEVELGESASASGTVIGPPDQKTGPAESDIRLAGSDVKLGGSEIMLGGSDLKLGSTGEAAKVDVDSKVSGFEELDLSLDDDLTLEDSQIRLSDDNGKAEAAGSSLDLSNQGESATDDDLVLGGSGSGSDITIGGDSGISLVDPADSGLSLEDPLDLGGGEESLELGEDDMLTLSEEADTEAPTTLKTDDDFLLTPLEESGEEDAESGSQVIALDGEVGTDDAATMIARQSTPSMAAMLEEDLGAVPGAGPLGAATAPLGMPGFGPTVPAGPGPAMPDAALAAQMMALPEAPYSVWNVLSLALCAILLILGGMMSYDLLRNMWSWNAPYSVNSSLMDWILGLGG
jgi:excisionase family DNA binding protein